MRETIFLVVAFIVAVIVDLAISALVWNFVHPAAAMVVGIGLAFLFAGLGIFIRDHLDDVLADRFRDG